MMSSGCTWIKWIKFPRDPISKDSRQPLDPRDPILKMPGTSQFRDQRILHDYLRLQVGDLGMSNRNKSPQVEPLLELRARNLRQELLVKDLGLVF